MVKLFADDEDLEPCPHCSGAGRVKQKTCLLCNGEGYVSAEEYDDWVGDLNDD